MEQLIPAGDATLAALEQAAQCLRDGRTAQSEAICLELLRVQPGNTVALGLAGVTQAALGKVESALEYFDRALTADPGLIPIARARADLYRRLGRFEEAAAADAGCIAGQLHQASALMKLGHVDAALALYRQLLERDPGCADAHNGVGAVLRAKRDFAGALQSFAAALQFLPRHAAAASNYGLTLHDVGRSQEAAAHLQASAAAHPQHLPSLHNLGLVLHSIDRHEAAAASFERLLTLAPQFPYAAANLVRARLCACDWSGYPHESEKLLALMQADGPASDPLTTLMVTGNAELQARCIARFAAREYPAANPLAPGEPYRHRRIRVAYLSADFHDHPVAYLLAGVLERHDRAEFEILGVSLRRVDPPGPMHARLEAAFEHFIDASDYSDTELAAQLRLREVDIAVDLGAFTRGARPGVMARRPAPVQINFLGFAGTYGAPYIDYLIADAVVIPQGREAGYQEHIVRLPHSFLPGDAAPRSNVARGSVASQAARIAAGLPQEGFVFCAFSNSYKITPPFFDAWMTLLRETPLSVLWLREYSTSMRTNLSREAQRRGVAPHRLIFAPRLESRQQHLARYSLADLFLDTCPYGAHATAQDALRAGLPVLTCTADSMASRVAASLLTALGLPELITSDRGEYLGRARRLALEPDRLELLRRRLDVSRHARATFDPDLYRRHLEAAYRSIWSRQESGQAAADLEIADQS